MSDKNKNTPSPGATIKMKDVAAHAGVSIKTVSRVLNNEPYVQDALRQKVREAVEALDYVPSQSARALRGARSYNITLICHRGNSPYINEIQFGAMVACQKHGYQLSIALVAGLEKATPEEIRAEFEKMRAVYRSDGVILTAPYSNDPRILDVLHDLQIPTTCVGPMPEGSTGNVVQIDEYAAAKELTQHLIDLGHRRIAFVRGLEDQQATHVRFRAFEDTMRAAGLEVDQQLVQPGNFQFEGGFEAGEKLFALDHRPTAVFAANDDMAAGLITAARLEGIEVPRDLSVVGFDDSSVAVRMVPRLTTVRQPIPEFGEQAIISFVENLGRGGELSESRKVLPHELILRETTAPLKD